jgi:uncharacterized protein (DUF2249 family)
LVLKERKKENKMKLHSRYNMVRKKENEFRAKAIELLDGLTHTEVIQILNNYISTELKYQLRYERHGTYEKMGDEA